MIRMTYGEIFVALATVVLSTGFGAATNAKETKPVRIRQGVMIGTDEGDVESFRGIPFAAPPVGLLRWRPPQPMRPWNGILRATAFGSPCMQSPSPDPTFEVGGTPSEDCLTVNVWRPASISKPLPVMVWIYGGAFISGASNVGIYNGASFARQGVILVSLNYRVGRFGFFAHPALTREAQGGPVANYGIMDQIAALKWVRANISALGGDPKRVTIFGQSAGAISTNFLMTSPAARGLFQQAISESGFGPEQQETLSQAEKSGAAEAKDWGVQDEADPAALRAVPAATIQAIGDRNGLDLYAYGRAPIIDGRILRSHVIPAFERGVEATVPYIVGTTDIEFPYLPGAVGNRKPAYATLPSELKSAYGDEASYSRDFASDALLVEPAQRLADSHAPRASTYRYRFAIMSDAAQKVRPGAPHGSELPYVFQNYKAPGLEMEERDKVRGAEIATYWVNFAKTGNPNGANLPVWPAAPSDRIMVFTNDGPTPKLDPAAVRIKAIRAATPSVIKPLVRPHD